MSALPEKRWTVEEYLDFERASDGKHEYLDGEVYAMTGASRNHNRIVFNTARVIGNQLVGGPCEGFSSDMRVWVPAINSYTYPDVLVVCGEVKLQDDKFDTLLNPTVVIEVLSASTEQTDRGTKFHGYTTMPSVQEYLLIEQKSVWVEHYVRQPSAKWLYTRYIDAETVVTLSSIECTLALADVYYNVMFEEA